LATNYGRNGFLKSTPGRRNHAAANPAVRKPDPRAAESKAPEFGKPYGRHIAAAKPEFRNENVREDPVKKNDRIVWSSERHGRQSGTVRFIGKLDGNRWMAGVEFVSRILYNRKSLEFTLRDL
jgi:hypothetical protein